MRVVKEKKLTKIILSGKDEILLINESDVISKSGALLITRDKDILSIKQLTKKELDKKES